MKKSVVVVVASLALNVVLLAVLGFALRPRLARDVPPRSPSPTPARRATTPEAKLSPADRAALECTRDLIESGDLHERVARLRAAGFSADVIRAILTAQVSADYGRRRVEVVARQSIVPYWRNRLSFPDDPQAGFEIKQLFREQAAVLADALGPDADAKDEWSALIQRRQYGWLSPEKGAKLRMLQDDYNDLRNETFVDARGIFLKEDSEKLALLERERKNDIAALLTPEELEGFELRTSPAAEQLRNELAAFNTTEDEFKALYRLRRDTEEKRAALEAQSRRNGASLEFQQQLAALYKQQGSDIATTLGPERLAQYRTATNNDYRLQAALVQRLGLPPTAADELYHIQSDTTRRANLVQQDRALTPTQKAEQIAKITTEAQSRLNATLGATGYAIYQNNRVSSWLTLLQPNPKRGK